MGTRVLASVNPPLLRWAREQAGYSLPAGALRARVSTDKLSAWEQGEAQPTVRQAEHLAKVYDRAFAVLSLPAPPEIPPLAADYRRLPGVRAGEESPDLRRALRRLVQRRRLGLHLLGEIGDEASDFPLRANLSENIEDIARRVRAALGVSPEEQAGWSNEYMAFRRWRSAVEDLGVLVCQMQNLPIEEVRGVSIVRFPLPVIGISSKELPLSKPFTLFHELVHLCLAVSHEEEPAMEETRNDDSWLEVERFCEAAAGAALMPRAVIENDREVVLQRARGDWTVAAIRRTAGHFKVTPSAAATRLLRIGLMTPAAYARWKKQWQEYTAAHPGKSGGGFATPAEKAVNRNGPLFTRMVLSALNGDVITSVDASHFLELGFDHVETLRRDWCRMPTTLAAAMDE